MSSNFSLELYNYDKCFIIINFLLETQHVLPRMTTLTNFSQQVVYTHKHTFVDIHAHKCNVQGALLFKVLPEDLCPSSGVQLTHKITKPNGCLTQTTPLGCWCCTAKRSRLQMAPEYFAGISKKATTALASSGVNMSDLVLGYKGDLNVGWFG